MTFLTRLIQEVANMSWYSCLRKGSIQECRFSFIHSLLYQDLIWRSKSREYVIQKLFAQSHIVYMRHVPHCVCRAQAAFFISTSVEISASSRKRPPSREDTLPSKKRDIEDGNSPEGMDFLQTVLNIVDTVCFPCSVWSLVCVYCVHSKCVALCAAKKSSFEAICAGIEKIVKGDE